MDSTAQTHLTSNAAGTTPEVMTFNPHLPTQNQAARRSDVCYFAVSGRPGFAPLAVADDNDPTNLTDGDEKYRKTYKDQTNSFDIAQRFPERENGSIQADVGGYATLKLTTCHLRKC